MYQKQINYDKAAKKVAMGILKDTMLSVKAEGEKKESEEPEES